MRFSNKYFFARVKSFEKSLFEILVCLESKFYLVFLG